MRRQPQHSFAAAALLILAAVLGGCPPIVLPPDTQVAADELAAVDAAAPRVAAVLRVLGVFADLAAAPHPSELDPNALDPNVVVVVVAGLFSDANCPVVTVARDPNLTTALDYADDCTTWRHGDVVLAGGVSAARDPNSDVADLTFDALRVGGRAVTGVATLALAADGVAVRLAGSFDLTVGEFGKITGICTVARDADDRLLVESAYLRLWDVPDIATAVELTDALVEPTRTGDYVPAGGIMAFRVTSGARVVATFVERSPDDGWVSVASDDRGPDSHQLPLE